MAVHRPGPETVAANETAAAWRLALERKRPCFFALTRQDIPVIDTAKHDVYACVSKGAYVLQDAANPQLVMIATGSEMWTSLDAAKLLADEGDPRSRSQLAKLEDL